MTSAAILSREVCRDTPRHPEVRQRLHDRFDPWLDRLEDRMQEAKPTMEELTQALLALRQEWTHEVAEGVVERAYRVTMEPRTAPYPPGWADVVGPWPTRPRRGDAGGGDPAAAPVL